jgi:hypothetical protein
MATRECSVRDLQGPATIRSLPGPVVGPRRQHMRKLGASLMCLVSVAVFSTHSASGASTGTARPFRASGSGSGTTVLGDPATFTIDGTHTSTHLGPGTFHNDGVCTVPNCSESRVRITVMADNGDTLIIVGDAIHGSFAGGTGRFARARGTVTTSFEPVADDALHFHLTFTQVGTITY